MKATAIIPARYASSRLPGKPLICIKGKPLIQYVYERVCESAVDQVVVATDDARIASAVERFGGHVRLTGTHHRTGTERVAEVAAHLDAHIIVNVQGDEPLIEPHDIDRAVDPLRLDRSIPMTTLVTPLRNSREITNPHVVKVVIDRDGFALYFSRSPIPYPKASLMAHNQPWGRIEQLPPEAPLGTQTFWQHIGLYAFTKDFLLRLVAMPPGILEKEEGLEQLRVLEQGHKIKTVVTDSTSIGIDTPEDVQRFTLLLESR